MCAYLKFSVIDKLFYEGLAMIWEILSGIQDITTLLIESQ